MSNTKRVYFSLVIFQIQKNRLEAVLDMLKGIELEEFHFGVNNNPNDFTVIIDKQWRVS